MSEQEKNFTVLLVEDDDDIRDVYAEVLRDAGYVVVEASDGQSGVDVALENPWDILLLDIMLPKLDGMAVLRDISADARFSSKPVLIISNLDDQKIVKDCFSLGAKGFFVKSGVTPQDILDVVKQHVSSEDE